MSEAPPVDAGPPWPPVAELVPHEPPMLLIEAVLDWSPERARISATVRPGSPFVHEGRLEASYCLEYMAQAIAAARGLQVRLSGEPPSMGVLLGSRELRLEVESLAVGDALELVVERVYVEGKLGSYACETWRAGQRVASATINVMSASAEDLAGGEGAQSS
ncbi:hypothetical protein G6O69_32075 [Pseudenhygromyxa sp. WMMC2535]|uniref:ApeP family dehydratase n=1 Tax=Pseudenhygromyxa sp. WMMC2535 TaxID=2712867 RepID=UPI001557D30D|nr:hypothetical protein [Pseudenhygromyxa sp. WMMC2535]NVB42505.1 hypothetical protein [Pseudenhygromyxa sp. WMMC2535]